MLISWLLSLPTGDNCVDGSSENVNLVVAQSNMGDDCVDGSPENNGLALSNGEDVQSPRDMGMERTLMQYWEVGQGLSNVQGRLRQNLSFWMEVLLAPSPILGFIEHGYRLPLKHVPPAYIHYNHNSTELHSDIVEQAVYDLLEKRCILKVDKKRRVCSKYRLVLNSRFLNQFMHIVKFKYEDLCMAALMFEIQQ